MERQQAELVAIHTGADPGNIGGALSAGDNLVQNRVEVFFRDAVQVSPDRTKRLAQRFHGDRSRQGRKTCAGERHATGEVLAQLASR